MHACMCICLQSAIQCPTLLHAWSDIYFDIVVNYQIYTVKYVLYVMHACIEVDHKSLTAVIEYFCMTALLILRDYDLIFFSAIYECIILCHDTMTLHECSIRVFEY